MAVVDESSPYYKALIGLVASINQVVPLEEPNQVLIVISLDTEQKIKRFAQWIRERLSGENDLKATEMEIVQAAVQIGKTT